MHFSVSQDREVWPASHFDQDPGAAVIFRGVPEEETPLWWNSRS